ncbi:hypothetical protein DPMN_099534 [Dreissena polymorpha]|uniref:Fucosyltransferase n=2 Tax=Dreissena polymorpha TaxID=45954 RepID=A0A9D4LFN0_DREPO|nr:hypothetical protein DPMN_099534 [Dreissena polymorpha]
MLKSWYPRILVPSMILLFQAVTWYLYTPYSVDIYQKTNNTHTQWNKTQAKSLLDNIDEYLNKQKINTSVIGGDVLSSGRQSNDLVLDSKNKLKIYMYNVRQLRLQGHLHNLNMSKCAYSNCEVLLVPYITDEPVGADALLFQANVMHPVFPRRRSPSQVFVFLNNEPPLYVHAKESVNAFSKPYLFNWTITYRKDSDIWMPYGHIIPRYQSKAKFLEKLESGTCDRIPEVASTVEVFQDKPYNEIFKNKTEHILWIVSHCKTQSKREKYVKEMQKFTKVDIFGACSGKKPPHAEEKNRVDMQYKFYLAFENSLCTDYITEKVYKWYPQDIIVVVRGKAKYSKFLPNNTYINADDFNSPRALSEYLNELGSNEEAYTGFLKRKDLYHVVTEVESVQTAFCSLCRKLNNVDFNRKTIENVTQWWYETDNKSNTNEEINVNSHHK